MSHITQIIGAVEAGDPRAAEQLFALVYDQLRKLAATRLAQEKPGQTLEATALVHEAYLRLLSDESGSSAEIGQAAPAGKQQWNSRGHFFAAAGEAMRRILVENARRKLANKRGGGLVRRALLEDDLACSENPADLLLVHEALDKLALEDAAAAQLVKLHFFAALTMDEAAQSLDMSTRSAQYLWAYARSWLRREMRGT